MAVTITPSIAIDGEKVECAPDKLDSAPLAIRGFEIKWGREDYLTSQGSPSTAQLTVIDTTATWPRLIRSNLAMGLPVEITWSGDTGGGGTCFRGRVTHAAARPTTIHATDNRRAWEISITAADYTADLGNVKPLPATWPRETYQARVDRISELASHANSGIENFHTHPRHRGDYVAPLDVKDESCLSLMLSLYASASFETYSYNHTTGDVEQVVRLQAPYTMSLAAFDKDLGEVSITADPVIYEHPQYGDQQFPGIAIGSCDAVSEAEISTIGQSSINEIQITYPAYEAGNDDRRIVRGAIRPGDAPRVMDFESWLESTPVIEEMAAYVLEKAIGEGSRPVHPIFTLHPGHDFRSVYEADWLLTTWESLRPAYLNGDLPYWWMMDSATDYAPVVCPIGGELSFTPDSGWDVELTTQWLYNIGAPVEATDWQSLAQLKTTTSQPSYPWWYDLLGIPPPPPVTVGEPTPERDVRWGDPASMQYYGFAKSVMWNDLRWVDKEKTEIKDVK